MSIIKLKTNDEQVTEVSAKVACLSRTINTMLIHLKGDSEKDADFVPLTNIDGPTLQLVIEWAEKHQNDPQTKTGDTDASEGAKDEMDQQAAQELSTWDKEFFGRLVDGSLYNLISAANFLDIPQLFALSCKEAATQLSSMHIEEIRTEAGIENDLSAEREAQLIQENSFFDL